jgi:hypothetical protein
MFQDHSAFTFRVKFELLGPEHEDTMTFLNIRDYLANDKACTPEDLNL